MAYTCPKCGRTSQNPNDEQEQYCGACHEFEGATRLPVTLCWHCDRALDGAAPADDPTAKPFPGAVSLCMYCGAIGVFAQDLRLQKPTSFLLDDLEKNRDFLTLFARFSWARQRVMLKHNLMRDGEDADR